MTAQSQYQFATTVNSEAIESLNANGISNHATKGDISRSISFENGTGVEVCIMDRNGVLMTLPAKSISDPQFNKALQVYERWSKSANVKINVDDELNVAGYGSKYTGALLSSFELTNEKSASSIRDRGALLRHKIDLEHIKQSGGGIYVHTLDIVVYLPTYRKHFIHPYCLNVLSTEMRMGPDDTNSLKIRVCINDPDFTMGDRFINAGGMVYRISPTRDKRRPPGAIIETVELDQPSTVIPCTLHDLSEHIQTYATYEEAEKQGKQHELKMQEQARELEQLKTSNLLLQENLAQQKTEQSLALGLQKSEIEKAAHALEAEKIAIKERQQQLDELAVREKHLLEMQQMRTKDYYENRSYDRKDTSEFFKFLPILLGAGIGLLIR